MVDSAKLDGTAVWDFHGKKLGDVQQVLLDPTSGRTRYVVLQVDKEWSLNDPEIAVPWSALRVRWKDDKNLEIALDANKEKLVGAPRYKAGDSNRLYNRDAGNTVYSYWGMTWMDDSATPARMNTGTTGTGTGAGTGAGKTGTGAPGTGTTSGAGSIDPIKPGK